mgnify:CR=1 FL=1
MSVEEFQDWYHFFRYEAEINKPGSTKKGKR